MRLQEKLQEIIDFRKIYDVPDEYFNWLDLVEEIMKASYATPMEESKEVELKDKINKLWDYKKRYKKL